jgi:hypothetical protein
VQQSHSGMPPARSRRSRSAIAIEIIAAAVGIALVVAAASATQSWLDGHFLPSFFVPRRWYVLIETVVRSTIATAGVVLVLARSKLAQSVTRAPVTTVNVVMAVAFAFASGELALRWIDLRPTEWLIREEEPRRLDDPELGWVLAPERTGRRMVSGRVVEYAIDAEGYRVSRAGEPVDRGRPTMLFAGESVMFGEGLLWDESIPAQVGAMLGIQDANLAVHGYSTDQIYLRVARELPRFRRPVAVVTIFMTELFGRNLDDDRPHLAPGLVWQRAERTSTLVSIGSLLVPYRRDATVDRGFRITREAFLAIANLARQRGATPLVIVPQFGAEDELQRTIRQRIMKDDIPTLLVGLDPNWRLAWDRHPNGRAAHVIAAAVAARLQGREPAFRTSIDRS